MTVTLRPYQQKIEDECRAALFKGEKKICVVAPTGSGKTALFADISQRAASKTNRVLILTHRREIMEQTTGALFRLGVVAGQIASDRAMTRESVQVAMVGTLIHRLGRARRPDLIIIDECFPEGTNIDGIDIKNIKIGDIVNSYNHKNNTIELKEVINIFSRNYKKTWYKINLSNGKNIICTEGHPIYTKEKGYIPAMYLTSNDAILYTNTHEMPKLQQRNNSRSQTLKSSVQILFNKMQIRIQKQEHSRSSKTLLLRMWERSDLRKKAIPCLGDEKREGLLFGRVQKKSDVSYIIKNNESDKFKKKGYNFIQDERKKSDVNAWNKRKNAGKNEGEKIQGTRRKWKNNKTTNGALFGYWIQNGIRNFYEKSARIFSKYSNMLQTGFSISRKNVSYRDRRERSFEAMYKNKRCKKRSGVEFSRVESIEIYKQGDRFKPGWVPKNNTVYNLHIKDNENYFANGILVHNCHHAISPSWFKILNYWSDVPRIGFTATPERLDGRGLGEIFSTMILGPTTAQLVRDKWLAEPILYRPPHEITAKYHIKRGDFDQGEQEQKMSSRAIVGDVIEHYRQHLSGLPAVCFCVSIKHSYLMAEQFKAAGFTSAVVEGGMKKSDRDAALKGLADGSVQVVCSCDVISEGVDVPVMAGAILLRRTASLALYLQQAGRALRMSPGKTDAVILDHAGNYHLHGHVLDDRNWTLNARSRKDRDERPPAITTCPVCYGVWPGHPTTCPSCGFEFEQPRDREQKPLHVLAGELVRAGAPEDEAARAAEVYQRAMAAKAKDRQKILLGAAFRATDKRTIKALAEAIGYSAGWADWAWEYRTQKMR
jgi:superfamily II DNA or RNA helicase